MAKSKTGATPVTPEPPRSDLYRELLKELRDLGADERVIRSAERVVKEREDRGTGTDGRR